MVFLGIGTGLLKCVPSARKDKDAALNAYQDFEGPRPPYTPNISKSFAPATRRRFESRLTYYVGHIANPHPND